MGNRHVFRPVLTGVVAVVIILFAVSLIMSLLLHFTSLRESSLHWFLFPITLVTLFIGGAIAGYQSGTKGWYYGGLTGIVFLLFTWLISYLGFDLSFQFKTAWLYAALLLLSVMGGMIGVNMSPQQTNE